MSIDRFKQIVRNFLRRTGAFILVVALALVSLSFIAHIPAVQNFGIQHITGILSNITGTKVEVRKFHFNFFSALSLSDVYVESPENPGDTLIFSESLDLKFASLTSLTRSRLVIRSVVLENAMVHFSRPDSSQHSTFTEFLKNFEVAEALRDSSTQKSSQFKLEAGSLTGKNLAVRYDDDHKNTLQEYHLDQVDVVFKEIVLDSSIVRLESAYIDGFKMALTQFAEPDVEIVKDSNDVVKPLRLEVGDFVLSNSAFRLQNFRKPDTMSAPGMRYSDLDISDVEISVADFTMEDLNFTGQVSQMSFEEKSGFQLDSLSVSEASVMRSGIYLHGLHLGTPNSRISDTLRFEYTEYEAFKDFANKVRIYADLNNTRLAIQDLLQMAPALRNSGFFSYNIDKTLVLTGQISGNINRLRARNLSGSLGEFTFKGDFRSNNLTVKGEQLLNLRIERVVTSARILRNTMPNLKLTDQYDNLGRIIFSGRYDGYFNDFVAFGQVSTKLGSASLDMRLDVTDGLENGNYSGGIALDTFDLGAWTEKAGLGRITASVQILEGAGLTAESANGKIRGGISSIEVKGYEYQNVVINGLLDENYFSGELEVVDDNIDLGFNGTVDLRGENPRFDFKAEIDTVNFQALNLLKDSLSMSGEIEISGSLTEDRGIDGYARASGLKMTMGLNEFYELDTLSFISISDSGLVNYAIVSDYINGQLIGEMKLATVYPVIAEHMATNYPDVLGGLKYKKDTTGSEVNIDFGLSFSQPEAWSGLLGIHDVSFNTLGVNGNINTRTDSFSLYVNSPRVQKGKIGVDNLSLYANLNGVTYDFGVACDSFLLSSYAIDSVAFFASGDDESMEWKFGVNNFMDSLALDLAGVFAFDTSGRFELSLHEQHSSVFDPGWNLHVDNKMILGKDFIQIDSFGFSKNDLKLEIMDINRRGLKIVMENFDAHFIDAVWDYDKLDFGGLYSVHLYSEDIFDKSKLNFEIHMDDLQVNGDSYGAFDVAARTGWGKEKIDLAATLGDPDSAVLDVDGWFDPSIDNEEENLDVQIGLNAFPGSFLEYFLPSISNTHGTATGVVFVTGDTSQISIDGSAMVEGAETTLDVTGVRYKLRDFKVKLTNDFIDLSNAIVEDKLGNTATVEGGLRHTMLKDLVLDIRVQSDRILGLELPKDIDNAFYGRGIGSADLTFTGTTKIPSLVVNSTTAPGTQIYIPLDQGEISNSESFLIFIERDSMGNVVSSTEQEVTSSLDLEMNLTITPDARVDMIFNEDTREILRGIGEGDIQINLNRAGDLTFYGGVEIVSGNYLFASILVNKPFVLRPGGTIRWSGDPYDASINISADYEGLRTSVSTLLEEYLLNASTNAQQQARQLTKVQLGLLLTGQLTEPTINFDIRFPDVTGELSGYIDSKMKALQSDPNGLNQQVFGLLIAGTFLPSSTTTSSNSLAGQAAFNTMTEFVSNQLSFFVSDFLAGAVEEVDFISGIDFDIGYNESVDYIDQSSTYKEWEVHMRNRLFNDRFIVDVGGSYVVDNPIATQNTYFAGDYALEYILTEDRRLKVRLYYRNEATIEGRKNKTGLGLSYRREFDNFGDWLRGLEKDAKKVKDKGTREGEQQDIN